MRITRLAIAGLAAGLISTSARAQYHTYDVWNENFTVQALLGAVQFDNLKFKVSDSTTPEEIDLSLIPQLGGAWGTLPKGDRLQYGLECSFLLGFMADKVNYIYLGGGGARASISTSMWMFDLAGGVYANLFLDKSKKVRLYGGAGPLMVYADYQNDTAYDDGTTPADNTNETAFGVGVYARTGIEFRIYEQGMLGMGARGSWSSVDFSDVGGSSDLVGLAVFVSFTAGF
ncbi:MAG: hypothetical protein K9M54_04985 [Kiritimatiellales bacterium]|nr:hypothetical protein [Kiritimatiellales bacterium]